MAWIITTPNGDVDSDDFTLADLGVIESESDTFWSIANPFRQSKVARAFLRVAYRHTGADPDDVDKLTMRTLKAAFDHRPDEPADTQPPGPTRGRKARTIRYSSPGAPTGTDGPPPSPEPNASGT